MIRKLFRRLWCALDMHGPTWGGYRASGYVTPTSVRTGPLLRACPHCLTEWESHLITLNHARTYGPWRRREKRANLDCVENAK